MKKKDLYYERIPTKLLREDVKYLGNILGKVIKIQEGQKFFDLVEKVRKLSKTNKKNPNQKKLNSKLLSTIKNLNPKNTYSEKVIKTGKKLLAGALRTAAAVTLGEGGQAVAEELIPIRAENSIKKLRNDLVHFIKETIQDDKTKEIRDFEGMLLE